MPPKCEATRTSCPGSDGASPYAAPLRGHADTAAVTDDPFLLGVDLKGEATRKAPAQTELRPTCAVARNADAEPPTVSPGSALKAEATRKSRLRRSFALPAPWRARHAMTLLGRVVRYADPPTATPTRFSWG